MDPGHNDDDPHVMMETVHYVLMEAVPHVLMDPGPHVLIKTVRYVLMDPGQNDDTYVLMEAVPNVLMETVPSVMMEAVPNVFIELWDKEKKDKRKMNIYCDNEVLSSASICTYWGTLNDTLIRA